MFEPDETDDDLDFSDDEEEGLWCDLENDDSLDDDEL